jgi:hypothetical protein
MRNAILTLMLLFGLLAADANPAGLWEGLTAARLRLDSGTTPAPWTPADLSTQAYYWFDLSDTNTMTFAGANEIAQVRSKGSVTNAMFVNSNYPLLTNDTTSGKSCANFLAADQRGWNLPINIPMPASGGSPYTFIGAYSRETNGVHSILWSSVATTYGQPAMHFNDNVYYAQIHGKYRGYGSDTTTGRRILATIGTGAETNYTVRFTGASRAETTSGNLATATNVTAVGFYSSANNRYHRGLMFELLYIPTNIPTAETEKLEGYLAHKWGFATSLPTNHPYYSSAPQK